MKNYSKTIDEVLEDSPRAMVNALKNVAEDVMYEFAGMEAINEGTIVEDELKDTVLEYAQTMNRKDFYEQIRSIGLARNSTLVQAVEPLLKD